MKLRFFGFVASFAVNPLMPKGTFVPLFNLLLLRNKCIFIVFKKQNAGAKIQTLTFLTLQFLKLTIMSVKIYYFFYELSQESKFKANW